MKSALYSPPSHSRSRSWVQHFHLDLPLLAGVAALVGFGLIILYSGANQNINMVMQQSGRLVLACGLMVICAQISPEKYRLWAPWLFAFGIILLLTTLVAGHIGKGAQRWLSLGVVRFQPSEIMKLAIPLTLAWYLSVMELPPRFKHIVVAGLLILIPALLVAKQPDLGTALMLALSGACVLLLAGMSWRYIIALLVLLAGSCPVIWHFMHTYQRQRVLTFLSPERDPLGSGYHIIQSKIAIGAGGIFGKGWLQGSQSHLHFLPEHATDFIFSVCGEEFGLIGAAILIGLYVFITARGLYISSKAQDSFTRLLAGSLSLTFFISMFINIGMVSGILPVVGVPLPLVSYGGTSMVTLFAFFGILMSISTHRKLVAS